MKKGLTIESLERVKDSAFDNEDYYLFWNCDKCEKVVPAPDGALIDSKCKCGRSFMGYWRDRK